MPDIYAYRSTRSPRRAEPDAVEVLRANWVEELPGRTTPHAEIDTHLSHLNDNVPQWANWGDGPLIAQLRGIVKDVTPSYRAVQAEAAAKAHLDEPNALNVSVLAGAVDAAGTAENIAPEDIASGTRAVALAVRLDRWLVARRNRPTSTELDAWLASSLRQLTEVSALINISNEELLAAITHDRRRFYLLFSAAWESVVDALAGALLVPERGELAQRLTRLLLVMGLLQERSRLARPLETKEVFPLLARRIPLMPDPPFPAVLPAFRVELVRQATVSDLYVVRQEWRCYVPSDIADIRNVFAGEQNEQQTTRIDEREVIEVSTEESASTSETSSEAEDSSTFNEQVRHEMNLALHAEGQVDVSAQYGPAHINASAGFSADFSLEDANERATQTAKHAVARAASKIESRQRSERSERVLARLEDLRKRSIENGTGEHLRGIYRWVNRIDRLQIWRYPDRLQLEFQIPEPGRFLLAQLSETQPNPASIAKPPIFELPIEGITRDNYLSLAIKYGASGLPEPPEPTIGVSEAFPVRVAEGLPTDGTAKWNAMTLSERKEVGIPGGYAATQVSVRIDATPIRAKWVREMELSEGVEDIDRFHTITASVAVGDRLYFVKEVGPNGSNKNSTQAEGGGFKNAQFLDAQLHAGPETGQFTPPLTDKIPIAVSAVGAATATVAVRFTCKITDQAIEAWRQDIYDGLRSAYDLWLREWRASQAGNALSSRQLAERTLARNAEMIRAEIRRHVVTWLLGEWPFSGRPAIVEPIASAKPLHSPNGSPAEDPAAKPPPGNTTPPGQGHQGGSPSPAVTPDTALDFKLETALAAAPQIQFLEQCLEWSNLSWVAYPYFWAGRSRWPDLMDLETVDPELGRFLRAGSIRVVVPARPGFAGAVMHWLLYRQPWFGGPAPLPESPLHVSIAQEIRDQTEPPPDGEPGESWEIILPTTLLWLDKEATLPKNDLARLGQPPHEPPTLLCPHGD